MPVFCDSVTQIVGGLLSMHVKTLKASRKLLKFVFALYKTLTAPGKGIAARLQDSNCTRCCKHRAALLNMRHRSHAARHCVNLDKGCSPMVDSMARKSETHL